jgi:hypothetical protein
VSDYYTRIYYLRQSEKIRREMSVRIQNNGLRDTTKICTRTVKEAGVGR